MGCVDGLRCGDVIVALGILSYRPGEGLVMYWTSVWLPADVDFVALFQRNRCLYVYQFFFDLVALLVFGTHFHFGSNTSDYITILKLILDENKHSITKRWFTEQNYDVKQWFLKKSSRWNCRFNLQDGRVVDSVGNTHTGAHILQAIFQYSRISHPQDQVSLRSGAYMGG